MNLLVPPTVSSDHRCRRFNAPRRLDHSRGKHIAHDAVKLHKVSEARLNHGEQPLTVSVEEAKQLAFSFLRLELCEL